MKRLFILTALLICLMSFTSVSASYDGEYYSSDTDFVDSYYAFIDLNNDGKLDNIIYHILTDNEHKDPYVRIIVNDLDAVCYDKLSFDNSDYSTAFPITLAPITVIDLNTVDNYKELILQYNCWAEDGYSDCHFYILRYTGKELKVICSHELHGAWWGTYRTVPNRKNIIQIAEPLGSDIYNMDYSAPAVYKTYKLKNKKLVQVKEDYEVYYPYSGKFTTSRSLAMYSDKKKTSVISTISVGKDIDILKISYNNKWIYVKYKGKTGWVNISKYNTFHEFLCSESMYS